MKRLRVGMNKVLYAVLGFSFIVQPSVAYGFSQAQRDIFDRGILYFNSDQTNDLCDLNGGISISLGSDIAPEPYNTIFSAAASAYDTNPQFLAALFLSENVNTWKPVDTKWASSTEEASGPFQFMESTWRGYGVDGDNNGVIDINNIYDSASSAAHMLQSGKMTVSSPLGSLDTPFKPGTFLEFGAKYNWGPRHMQQNNITATSPLTAPGVPKETREYLSNLYSLISSNFTKSGKPGYGDPKIPGSSLSDTATPVTYSCSAGVVADNVAQTAINLAWPGSHTPAIEATSAYINALITYLPQGNYYSKGADCGVFVSTVMHASQADPDYPVANTAKQEDYVRANPDKYDILTDVQSTADLKAGDILIVNQGLGTGVSGHTLIYLENAVGGNEASASLDTRMPSVGTISSLQDDQGRGHYLVARLKG